MRSKEMKHNVNKNALSQHGARVLISVKDIKKHGAISNKMELKIINIISTIVSVIKI